MILNKFRPLILFLVLSASLSGCSDTPSTSDVLADAKVTADADNFCPGAFEVVDLIRENGWKDGDNYKVKFTYNLKTKYDYPGVVLKIITKAAEEVQNMDESEKASAFPNNGMRLVKSVLNPDGLDLIQALDSYRQMPKVRDFIKSNSVLKSDEDNIFLATIIASSAIKNYGVTEAPVGTKISRQVTFTYMKTEKGWSRAG